MSEPVRLVMIGLGSFAFGAPLGFVLVRCVLLRRRNGRWRKHEGPAQGGA